MKLKALILTLTMILASAAFAQADLKVAKVYTIKQTSAQIEFPSDLNGNKCALIEVNAADPSVVFEGNVMGTPLFTDGRYYVFLTPNSKYLNIKYPGAKPLMVKFRDYDVTSLPSASVVGIDLIEPSKNLADKFSGNMPEVSQESEELYKKGEELIGKQDYISAYDYLLKSCDMGNPKAAYQLGMIYTDPFQTSRKLSKISKITSFGNASTIIPDMPVKRDLEKAYEYYKQSAEGGFALGQYSLGQCYEKGKGVKKNKDEAKKWYTLAAEQGHLQAKEKVGEKVKKNRTFGIVTSYGTSNNEFILNKVESDASDLSAISNGRKDRKSQYCALVKVLLPFDSVQFQGDTVGQPIYKINEYWVYMPQGTRELQINYPNFKTLDVNFKKMGVDQLIGKNTYTVSISFPVDLLSDDADLSADELYDIALGFAQLRDNQYLRWMEKASDKGHPQAMSAVGQSYLLGGAGIKKDKKKGLYMLEQASALGVGEASYYLGMYYEITAKKRATAQQWYDKAAEQGYEMAKGKKAQNLRRGDIFNITGKIQELL